MNTISLQSLDDAFYARKGVEMARSGHFFTVTLADEPTFQNPPLQFWIMGRAFALFGEHDAAARAPIVLMAIGMLLATVRIGALTVGARAGVTAVALLLITPLFSSTARGTMMEIPFGFWVTLAFLLFFEGVVRRSPVVWHLLMALPIAAAMLTKSVLGLVPIVVLPVVIAISPALRRRCGLSTAAGLALGVLLGLSWPLHQYLTFGPDALRHHYLGQVLEPSTQGVGLRSVLLGYPLILLRSFEPILLPGLVGLVGLARRAWTEADWRARLIVAWVILPIVCASASSAQSSRYIFPILTPMALCAAWWLLRVAPRLADLVTRWFTPVIACGAAAIFWIAPTWLTRDQNQVFKTRAEMLRRDIPRGATVGYVGTRYWRIANPLLYYSERTLTPLSAATDLCEAREVAFAFVDREQEASLRQCGLVPRTLLDGSDWVLVKFENR